MINVVAKREMVTGKLTLPFKPEISISDDGGAIYKN
jgi:hypothetical protein